jgi:hypothetical protein
MKNLLIIPLMLLCFKVSAQRVVYDKNHLNQVLANQAVRLSAEQAHQSNLKSIETSVKSINLNVASVVLIQDVIYRSLTEVREGLRDGLQVRNMAIYVGDVLKYSNQMMDQAKDEPYLLLFAEENMQWSKRRLLALTEEVNKLVLTGDKEVMMDYVKRDELLDMINHELILLRASVYRAYRAMHYAKQNGLLKSLNPYKNFIERDKDLVNEIFRNYNYLQR